MGENSFTEITTESWFSRIGSALKGILFGLLLFVVSFFLLFWNEGRTVERTQTLNEGSGAVISVDAHSIIPQNNDKLVHFSDFLTTDETLTDPITQVSAQVLKLYRNVSTFRWVENTSTHTETSVGGEKKTTTEYTYAKEWREGLENSSNFKVQEGHRNPIQLPLSSEELTTSMAKAGAFRVPRFLVNEVHNSVPLSLNTTKPLPEVESYTVHYFNGGLYLGSNTTSPTIGDMKISYTVVKPQEVSIIAQQRADTLEAYHTKAGGSIALLELGNKSAESMFQKAHEDNIMMQWILRALSFGMMVFGLVLIFSPLSVIADVVPFIGSIVGGGVFLFSLLVSVVLSFITIAMAWIFYRPLLGLALLTIAAGALWLIKVKFKKPEPETVAQ